MRTRARIVNLIGEELISDEAVAVVELVKNAYDADARNVVVSFEGSNPDAPQRIVVSDDGIGMDLPTVLNGWLELGTIMKKRADHSPGGRQYQGAKGIGRFATARLGNSLLLETKRVGQDDVVYVLLNWGKFTDDSYLDDIEIDYEVRTDKKFPIGTKLTIEGIHPEAWARENFERLHARLSRLLSPFRDVTEFDILLDTPGHPDLSGVVQPPEFLLRPKYVLTGKLDIAGKFSGTIAIDGKKEPVSRTLAGGDERPECGPFEVEIRAWDRDREGLGPIATRESMSIAEVRRLLDTYSGVAIYRDGFRVYPYGERGNDWLNLDLRSRQNPVRNLANNQIIAALRVARDENPDLRDRSTREGLVRNSAYEALENWFRRILTILEEGRYRVRPRQETSKRTDQLFEAFDLSGTVKEARSALGASHPSRN